MQVFRAILLRGSITLTAEKTGQIRSFVDFVRNPT